MLKSTKNSLIINNAVELGDNISLEDKGKGRHFTSRFIEAGLAHYQEFGDVLITKETLDKFVYTMVGCPVIITHKDITAKNADKERVGVVSKVWYNELDGWFWCEGIIWDKQAIDLIKNQGWSVSCTYDFESDFKKGTYHGKDYDMEFTGGEFLHLALVDNPRYERANIVVNSKDTVENDKWITIHPGSGDGEGKGKHLLLKDGESPKEAIERTYGKTSKKDKVNERIDARHKHQEAIKKHQKIYEDYEKGIGTFEDIEKADKELQKANEDFYGNQSKDDTESKGGKNRETQRRNDIKELSSKIKESPDYNTEYAKEKIKELSTSKRLGKHYFDVEMQDLIKEGHGDALDYIGRIYGKNTGNRAERQKAGFAIVRDIVRKDITKQEKEWIEDRKANNNKGDITMTVLNELKEFIQNVVNNKGDDMKAENEKVDKRDIIRQIMAIAGKEEASEEVKTIAKLAEKLAYDDSEDSKADNKAKNEEDEEKEEKFEEEKEIANKKAKNEEKEDEAENKCKNEEEEEKEEVKNKCKNSIDETKKIVFSGIKVENTSYVPHSKRIEMGNKY